MSFLMTWFPSIVYALCFLTCAACAWLLMRSYRQAGGRMLFWAAICFLLLSINNLMVIIDILIIPDINLGVARLVAALPGVGLLIYGFVWREEGL